MLDELGLRACWTESEEIFGVTTSMEVKYRKPVPYDTDLIGRGRVEKENSRFLKVKTEILDKSGQVLAEAEVKYIKLAVEKIVNDIDIHEEMHYLIKDDIKEINFE